MKIDYPALRSKLLQKLSTQRRSQAPLVAGDNEQQMQANAELFSVEQMEKHGQTLAATHVLSTRLVADQLLDRLATNAAILSSACRTLSDKALGSNRVSPAGEWLLDNYYLVEEQIRTAKRHLPKSYGRSLPKLAKGRSQGYPRVYDIALHVIAHGDGRWDEENLSRFICAYQSATPLMLRELWAVPIMLRLALIENLARIAKRVDAAHVQRSLAATWAEKMGSVAESDPKSLILVIADMARSNPPLTSAFVAELARRLQGRGIALALPLTWIEQRLAENGLTLDQLVGTENQQQATNQITVSNSIASLRRLGEMDWRDFVEQMSIVHRNLLADPDGTYAAMDFATRDQYRHVVEALARVSACTEAAIAEAAVGLAQNHTDRQRHVGYYLVDKGLLRLEDAIAARHPLRQRLRKSLQAHPVGSYIGLIGLLTLLPCTYLVMQAYRDGLPSSNGLDATLPLLLVLIAALLVAGSQLAVTLVNWGATLFARPHRLPRMDYAKGIPANCRTLVVVPAMLDSAGGLATLLEALEVRFLGNRDPALHFALLTDFNDAASEHCPPDATLLAQAQAGIDELNRRYPASLGDSFFLFHRPRQWNDSEKQWMGYERKRGKLSDLNVFLRSGTHRAELTPEQVAARMRTASGRFSLVVGNTDILTGDLEDPAGNRLPPTRYVITLDSDTQLPRDSARQFVGAMAHPLNRPIYAIDKQRVTAGHAILQPRVAEALPSPGPTRYARLCGSEAGIDPYTRTVSDVYQDLFDEGSFIGKGIYDIEVFEQALAHRFPDNTILSHDLIEGCYLRSGLLSDVPLYEQSPGSYLADVRRRTRWIRGDWQLAGWLLSRVPELSGKRAVNPLTTLSQWKLLDNLRRSLVPIALLTLLAMGWGIFATPALWLAAVLLTLTLPPVLAALIDIAAKPPEALFRPHLMMGLRGLLRRGEQLLLQFATLPHEAAYSLGAIAHTCWRMLVSRRHLLEWTPSDQANRHRGSSLEWLITMSPGPLLALGSALLLSAYRSDALWLAAPLLLLWFFSPLLAAWLSLPFQRKQVALNATETHFLHITARKIWDYFSHFVVATDNWLPPDNYQEEPREAIAHRTSPTNMGMALLANLSAYDFGYLSMAQLLTRTQDTLQSMGRLERYRGHFYNWYDTQTLEPLEPRYVSTVDSGNLSGYLIVLRQGLLELVRTPLLHPDYFKGLGDTLDVLGERLKTPPVVMVAFRALLDQAPDGDVSLSRLADHVQSLTQASAKISAYWAAADHESVHERTWAAKLAHQCQSLHQEIGLFSAVPGTTGRSSLLEVAALTGGEEGLDTPAIDRAAGRISLIETLAAQAHEMAQQDYSFLYNPVSRLMTVGFHVDNRRSDRGSYDLLSSEARLCSYVAIAQGQVPQENWFALGRLLTLNNGEPVLVSWSGSMFEYLMPMLVMPDYENTLLNQTCRAAVRCQIHYGNQLGLAWGISESGFNAVDALLNYQYRAFGVPGLGLKRGLAEDVVIAPYASVMALMIEPKAACGNMQRLAAEGASGRFGFYEAIDHTPSRMPRGKSSMLVRSFMVHHQGMSLLALSYLLHQRPMQRRFAADTEMRATLLLLQERTAKPVVAYSQIFETAGTTPENTASEAAIRVFENPNTTSPEVQLLSNGRYHLMLTQAGSGYSRWRDLAVTRWRADATCDDWGMYGYLRDVNGGEFWSSSYQPTTGAANSYRATFTEAHAEYTRREHDIETHVEIGVSPEDDIELRRIRIRNRSKLRRTLDYTSYAEVVLAPHAADMTHPAFGNLFVETEILPQHHAIVATRRPRSAHETPPWLCHMLTVHGDDACTTSYETDRARFIGRGNTLANPRAMRNEGPLSDTAGAVLDPIVAIRCRFTLEAGASITLDQITGISETRIQCMEQLEKYRDRRLSNRVFGLAWTHNQVLLRQLNASEADAQLYSRLAGAIIYTKASHRAPAAVLMSNQRGQSGLWGYSISGDLPIVLLQIEDIANIELVRQLLQAHAYWRKKGLAVDLVILNEEGNNYRQVLQDRIMGLMAAGTTINALDRSGGIFVRATEHMPNEDRTLLRSVAHVTLSDKQGTLAEQIAYRPTGRAMPARLIATSPAEAGNGGATAPARRDDLQFFNGIGGFSGDGEEYVIEMDAGRTTPAPWVNVIANPEFGTVISESGQAYTWTENAHEMRLTPWHNDPVRDTAGELYYLRDEDSGHFWSPTALPCRGTGAYTTRHGFGYSVFEHSGDGIHTELCVYVAMDCAIKFSRLRVRNETGRHRNLSVTGYVEWVLGELRSSTGMHVSTEINRHMTLLARNRYNSEFGERTAFFHAATSTLEAITRTHTGDRSEFIGRNGSHAQPAAMQRKHLSGRVGAGLDPCAAIQIGFELAPGQTRELVFMLGVGRDQADAEALVNRFRGGIDGSMAAQEVLTETRSYWRRLLGAVQVDTPDPAVNLLANGWLLYQTLASRLWARSGYYQSGGAFGFRDQLQDAMALVHTLPQRLRQQIVLCAGRQFAEGDVQHWWHPPQGRGVRTRCSDDYLWLPYALCRYIDATGDVGVLEETVPFLQGRMLNEDEESYYDLPISSGEHASVYEHAVRAIRHGLRFGAHGLPLMGSGDWNDGMNLVGEKGRGESVWLGFFLYDIFQKFNKLALRHGDRPFAKLCTDEGHKLNNMLENAGWDGEWYRRAYFDDGTPLGTASNGECRIDAIAQSWSVLSGAGSPERARMAMDAMHIHLVRAEDGLIQLLDPPFDSGSLNPGYIKGYVPGVRENGGQYTHGAIWAAMAFAELGETGRAWQLFNIINPINHGRTPAGIATYKIEPYVLAADVYGVAPHTGRGGWSWYTGSAGWMYRLLIESLLGLNLESTEQGQRLNIKPCLPDNWDSYTVTYRHADTAHLIQVRRATPGETTARRDAASMPLFKDGSSHLLTITV